MLGVSSNDFKIKKAETQYTNPSVVTLLTVVPSGVK